MPTIDTYTLPPLPSELLPAAAAPTTIATTLYDLISALQDASDPGQDEQVVATVIHLLRSGRLTFPRESAVDSCTAQALPGARQTWRQTAGQMYTEVS
jgi:hypothetical protein